MNYLPLTNKDRKEMLKSIGVSSVDDLLTSIPDTLKSPSISLPAGLSELELRRHMSSLAARNDSTENTLSFLGAGIYEHYIPSIVQHITSRSEFYTAYTPYQAEASQGTLQAIYEYQTMICRLTGMDVANASHYDGATSTAEAALMATNIKKRNIVLVSRSLHPEYKSVLKTYLAGTESVIEEIPYDAEGNIDVSLLEKSLNKNVACLIVQYPNFFGVVEDYSRVEKLVHEHGSLFIIASNLLSLARFKSPAEWRADIACGEGQNLGIPMSFGGPLLGYFAVKKELMRKMPGRIAGITHDTDGNRAFTLTLQAREQHIRREKASSNICSNQALCALSASVYLSAIGKQGIKKIADMNIYNSNYLRNALKQFSWCSIPFHSAIFNEFVVTINKDFDGCIELFKSKNINPGVDLRRWYPELGNALLVCATETKTKADLDKLIAAFAEAEKVCTLA